MVATHAIERGLTLHPLLLCTDEMVYRGQKLDMSSIKCQCFNEQLLFCFILNCYNFITFQTSGKFLLHLSIQGSFDDSQVIVD